MHVFIFLPAGIWIAVTTKIVWCAFCSTGKAKWLEETSWSIHNYRELQRMATLRKAVTHTHRNTRDVNVSAWALGSFHAYQLTYTPGGQITSIHTYSGQIQISESKLTKSHYTLTLSVSLNNTDTCHKNQTVTLYLYRGKNRREVTLTSTPLKWSA